jgi:hypothetical protein
MECAKYYAPVHYIYIDRTIISNLPAVADGLFDFGCQASSAQKSSSLNCLSKKLSRRLSVDWLYNAVMTDSEVL